MTSLASSPDIVRRSDLRRDGIATIGFAVAANLLVWIVGGLLLGEGIQVVEPGAAAASTLGAAPVLVASILPTVAGLLFVSVMTRFGWSRLAAGVVVAAALVSLVLPFTLEVATGSQIALAVMHLVVGGSVATFAVRRS